MPIIKASKKHVRATLPRTERNYERRAAVKAVMKKILTAAKAGKVADAKKLLPSAYKTIDLAAKVFVLHRNNAANKKSLLATAIAKAEKGSK